MFTVETRLEIFADMMLTVWGVFFWHYDIEDRIINTTCPDALLFDGLFMQGGSKRQVLEACKTSKKAAMIADSAGLVWIAAPYFENDSLTKFYVIGPVYASEISENGMVNTVRDASVPAEWKTTMLENLKRLPVIQHTSFTQFGIMLEYHVSGEAISNSDISFIKAGRLKVSLAVENETLEGVMAGSYNYESKLMKAIETGNIRFKRPPNPPKVGKLSSGDPIRQARNEILTFIVITSRAALRGGLPEETAYGLSDQYFLRVESEDSISQIYTVGVECYNDFLNRMYKLKQSQGRTREILNCIAYIESRLNEKIDYADMADKCGYSRNYLSVKFKSEMGMSMVDYITKQRIEQAKVLLRNSKDSIVQISDSLKFSSNSYFGSIFLKQVGVTPGEYRNGLDGWGEEQ